MSRSAPGTVSKNFVDGGYESKSRVSMMKSNTSESKQQVPRLGEFPCILIKRIRINDEKVLVGRYQIRIHENVSLMSDYGISKSISVGNVDTAKVIPDNLFLV